MEFFSILEHHRSYISAEWFDPTIVPPYCKNYFGIEYDTQYKKWVIEANSYIGIIPLDKNYGIQILPKSGLRNLTYMLFRSGLLNRSLETPFDYTVPYQIPEDDLESFFEGLVKSFLKCLDQIKSLGLIREDDLLDRDSYVVKGKINYKKWINQITKSIELPIPQKLFSYDLDNSINRTLRWCLEYLIKSPLKYTSRKEVIDRADYFGKVSVVPISIDDTSKIVNQIESGNIPSNRYYYLPALNLALMILRGSGLMLGEKHDIEFKPMVINTYDMFERYIRILCQNTYNKISMRAENGKTIPINFYSSTESAIYVKPDIVVKFGGSNILIIDVKYKSYPTEQDHYQMWAYMRAYQVKLGGFISLVDPFAVNVNGSTWYKRDDSQIFNFSFDCKDIRISEQRLNLFLLDILK
jgi:5-methylcytosine-specific restriction endonuclease McrBC regulatory subunit McrC